MSNVAASDTVTSGDLDATKVAIEFDPKLEIKIDPESKDADGFVSLWSVAAATMNGDLHGTRALASRFLGFLCKQECDFVLASSVDARYLDERFERDNKLLYDWTVTSENVDVLSQHASVPADGLLIFLKKRKFNPATSYSPRRADRVKWFTDDWCVG